MDEFEGVGVHPIKQLRRQKIEEFDESYQGKPAATVVRMTKSIPEQIPEPKRDVLFVPIVER